MSKYLYYAEIRNKMASKILSNPELLDALQKSDGLECKQSGLQTVCNEAARIFEAIQLLSEKSDTLNLSLALHNYSNEVFNQLLNDEQPLVIDLIVMAGQTLQQFC